MLGAKWMLDALLKAPPAKPRVHTCSGGQMPERPETDSSGYKRVVARGCLGTTDYWGEADCIYGWTCEECPVLREKWRQEGGEE